MVVAPLAVATRGVLPSDSDSLSDFDVLHVTSDGLNDANHLMAGNSTSATKQEEVGVANSESVLLLSKQTRASSSSSSFPSFCSFFFLLAL